MDFPGAKGLELKTLLKVVAAAATPEKLSATRKLVRQLTFFGCNALDTTPNTSAVFIGNSAAQLQQLVPYDGSQPGGEVNLNTPADEYVDLSLIYIRVGTNGDGVVVTYLE